MADHGGVEDRLRTLEREVAALRDGHYLLLATREEPGRYPYYEWLVRAGALGYFREAIECALHAMDERLEGKRAGGWVKRLGELMDALDIRRAERRRRASDVLERLGWRAGLRSSPTFGEAVAVMGEICSASGQPAMARASVQRMLLAMHSQGYLRDLCRHLLRDAGVRVPGVRKGPEARRGSR